MARILKRYGIWGLYAVFLALALRFGGTEGLLPTSDGRALPKAFVLCLYLGFLAYSILATKRENFMRSLGQMARLWWGRQIGMDLYVSVTLSLALIYLVTGSLLALALWLLPVLVFANLAILPFVLVNFGTILGAFGA